MANQQKTTFIVLNQLILCPKGINSGKTFPYEEIWNKLVAVIMSKWL